MRKTIVILAVIGLVVVGLAVPAGADQAARPFKGSMAGEVTFTPLTDCPNPWGLRTDSAATGKATHMGRLVMSSQHCTPMGHDITGGEMVFVAANGDVVYIDYEGHTPTLDELVPGEEFSVDIEFFIDGGTGRFEDASGGGLMTAFVLFEDPNAPVVAASWVWSGTIGY
jgi:hypothetical protein